MKQPRFVAATDAVACLRLHLPQERAWPLSTLEHVCMRLCGGPLQAVKDFMKRIQKYEEVYEPIQERHYHYIKLTDM